MAKAILDNSIDAQITSDTKDGDRYVNFQNGRKYLDRKIWERNWRNFVMVLIFRYMMSSETADVYRTTEPQNHFDTRIK